ncbi:MAG TPA: GNAT family N-acetyltransferase, partial [Micromonospora sp.]|nr:GNAT family N-acetyltransferase [Micromonospora sp.]
MEQADSAELATGHVGGAGGVLTRLDFENEDHRDAVWLVFGADVGFTQRAERRIPEPSDVDELFLALPPGMPPESKHVLGWWEEKKLLGIVDLVRGYPDASVAYIGLLQVRLEQQGCGLGERILRSTEALARGWPEIKRLRLAVVRGNWVAAGFWHRMGFAETGEVVPYARELDTDEAVLF